MKIVVLNNIIGSNKPYITLRPDNAVLRNNDDFYLPHISNDIVCGCGVVVRITRLAKCIAPKFSSRCYDSVTAGVTFVARDIMNQAIAEARPSDEAYAFDRSTAIGTEWIEPANIGDGILTMTIGGKMVTYSLADFSKTIDECVSTASQYLTLKTGDLLFIAAPIDTQVSVGENISVKFNEIEPLNFQVK